MLMTRRAGVGHERSVALFNSMEKSGLSIVNRRRRARLHLLHKTDYGNAVWHPLKSHRTDKSNSNTTENTLIRNSLEAQGKGIMHPVLTVVSLRTS